MEAIVLMLGAFGASGVLWTWQNRARLREDAARKKALSTMLDESMQVAVALAKHAAASRHQPFSGLHVMYALAQDERVAEKIARLGGDQVALEAALDRALDALDFRRDPREGNRILGAALGLAKAHDREMTLVDTLVVLLRTPYAALLDAPPLVPYALLFALVHGDQPPATLAGETHVHVIIRNDDFTTQQFVTEILRAVFELPEADATEKMRATHDGGRAIVGRYAIEVARDKIETVRLRAREQLMPLWIGVEVC